MVHLYYSLNNCLRFHWVCLLLTTALMLGTWVAMTGQAMAQGGG